MPGRPPSSDEISLAGALDPYTPSLVERLRDHWEGDPHVIYMLGDHEFYGTEIDKRRAGLAEQCAAGRTFQLDPGTVRS